MYHDFDDTPDGRPPTPLPPALLSNDDESDEENVPHAQRLLQSSFEIRKSTTSKTLGLDNDDGERRCGIPQDPTSSVFLNNHLLQLTKSSTGPAHLQQNDVSYHKTLPRNDLFLDKDETTRSRLNGRLEGLLIGQWLSRGLSLADAYQRVGLEYPDAIVDVGLGHEDAGERAKSPFSDISGMTDVSDPPSDLQSPFKEINGTCFQ